MDPDENRSEQIKIAKNIQALWASQPADRHEHIVQMTAICNAAKRLSELALDLFEWQEGRAS